MGTDFDFNLYRPQNLQLPVAPTFIAYLYPSYIEERDANMAPWNTQANLLVNSILFKIFNSHAYFITQVTLLKISFWVCFSIPVSQFKLMKPHLKTTFIHRVTNIKLTTVMTNSIVFSVKIQGGRKEFVWYKNKVKLLFFAHQLKGNMSPFALITLTNPWCHLFESKISI